MGGSQSLPLEAVEGFTPEEVARLHKRFRKLDKDSNESLCVEEFLALPELSDALEHAPPMHAYTRAEPHAGMHAHPSAAQIAHEPRQHTPSQT